ncbi:MAG: NAD-dependent succinate-semialdehyde dehydrogenase [Parashewanella sp.]
MSLPNSDLVNQACYINGQWLKPESCKGTVVINPADLEVISSVPNLGAKETQQAIDAAEQALKGWRVLTAEQRCKYLKKWHKLILERKQTLAAIITAEQGKPLAEAVGEIAYAASFIDWFAEQAKRVYGETIPSQQANKRLIVTKQPVGVTAAITPWNFPAAMITRKAAAALAAGCTMIIKPAPDTPLTALALAELAEKAGIPAGVLNVVTGDAQVIGKVLCESPVVKKLSFTGSTDVGRLLMAQCAPTIKKLSLELGGNAPFIVFNDADIDAAVEGAMASKFRNSGQTCICANRIYVQSGAYEEFTEKFTKAIAGLTVGKGTQKSVDIGPLINQAAIEKVEAHVADALAKGAQIKLGGQRHNEPNATGFFYQPTVLTGMNASMRIAREETFGPVAPLFSFDTVDDVIEQANNTEYGLASYFYSDSLSQVWKVAEALDYGMVGVNTGVISTEVAPFGGIKASGLGKEGGHQGIEEYLESKYINMQI